MRHRKRTAKLGRTSEHRTALLANLVCSLIKHRRIRTTLAKAKAARVVADKMVTLGKKGQDEKNALKYRRLISARLQRRPRRHFPKKNGVSGRHIKTSVTTSSPSSFTSRARDVSRNSRTVSLPN